MRRYLRIAIPIAAIVPVARLAHAFWINWQGWRANVHFDPSAAEFYSDGCLIDGAGILFVIAMTLALTWVLGLKPAESARKAA